MDILARIKRLVVSRRVLFTEKETVEVFYVLISSKRSTDL